MAEELYNKLINIIIQTNSADAINQLNALEKKITNLPIRVGNNIFSAPGRGVGGQFTPVTATPIGNIPAPISFADQHIDPGSKIAKEIDTAANSAKKYAKHTNDAKVATSEFSKIVSRAALVAPIWMVMRNSMMAVIGLVQSQAKFFLELETAMARIQIVGKGTAKEYDNLKYSLIGLSNAYGLSGAEALSAAKIFAQQGKSVRETFILTRAAMLGAQVLGQDVVTTTEDMTAAMNSFRIPAQNAVSIIDALINVEKQFAVTSKDLSAGIKTTGATAQQMGVTMAALAGDITAVIEVTRKSGSEAARGLSFIYARLLTSGKPVIEQLTGIKFYLDKNNKATSSLTGTLRSASDILGELAGKWNTLSNEERLEVATALGSKRQMVVLNALMQNYTHSIEARIAALTSAGASEKAFAILQNTTAFKIKQNEAAWNSFTAALGNTSAWKASLDAINYALLTYTKLINFEKGYRIEMAQTNAAKFKEIEITQNQIANIEELVALRKTLANREVTPENIANLQAIDSAIKAVEEKHPEIKAAIHSPDSTQLHKVVTHLKDFFLKQKISVQVEADFNIEAQALTRERRKLQSVFEAGTFGFKLKSLDQTAKDSARILEINKRLNELAVVQPKLQNEAVAAAKAELLLQTNITDEVEQEEEIRSTLTDATREQLSIEREINNFTATNHATLEEEIQKKIELVSASTKYLDAQAKINELTKLENDLIDAKLKKRDKEIDKLRDISLKYDEADAAEKERIKRATEISLLSAREVGNLYRSGRTGDRQAISENIGIFTDEQIRAIKESGDLFRQFGSIIAYRNRVDTENPFLKKGATAQSVINQTVTGVGTMSITINGSQLSVDDVARMASEGIKNNPDLQAGLASVLGKKI